MHYVEYVDHENVTAARVLSQYFVADRFLNCDIIFNFNA